MPVSYTLNAREMTAHISGEIDHHAAREIMTSLDRSIKDVLPTQLTLDLAGVTFMDSSGIAVLVRTKHAMDGLGGRLRVVSIPTQSRRVLDAAGVGRIISLEGCPH